MPIEATPFEQDVVAEATNFTLELTVLPLDGLLTVTPAKVDAAIKSTKIAVESCTCFFICRFLSGWIYLQASKALDLQGIHRQGRTP